MTGRREGEPEEAEESVPDPRSDPVETLRWLLTTENEGVVFARDLLSSAAAVALVGLVLFSVAGVWPPMVAVVSDSMEPQMHRGDLVFVVDEQRYSPGAARGDAGVVTARVGAEIGHRSVDGPGDVIVYMPPRRASSTPIIHRARFWVEKGENWYGEANKRFIGAESCAALDYCPAPHAGFITKGDNNPYYDQAGDIAPPVRPAWIEAKAVVTVPCLGYIRLVVSGDAQVADAVACPAERVGLA
jgi:signal peptidase